MRPLCSSSRHIIRGGCGGGGDEVCVDSLAVRLLILSVPNGPVCDIDIGKATFNDRNRRRKRIVQLAERNTADIQTRANQPNQKKQNQREKEQFIQ